MKYYKYIFHNINRNEDLYNSLVYGSFLYYRITDDDCVEFYREPDCEHDGNWLRSFFVSDEAGLIKKAENSRDELEIVTDERMLSQWLMEELVE